jgi:serine/threonine protein kinase
MRLEMGADMAADRLLSGPGAEGNASQSPHTGGAGRLIGRRYRLMSPVGRGGMGMVWQAHDVLLDRDVAVKELILPFGLDNAGKQVAHRRMLREARSAARLQHPGIVTVHDVVEEDGRPWIVMELVRAWSLEQAVRQSGPLPVIQAAEIGVRVLDALRHAHASGILHRDIKPGNVLLTADRVVLTDFGIAAIEGDVTITQTGLLMGSPAYVPPERLSGQSITAAADLWSFGATLYAAVEGRPPYEGPDAIAVLGAVLTQDPIRPERAGALLPVIEGLLRKNPTERLTAEQVNEALERVLRAHGSTLPRTADNSPLPTRQDPTPVGLMPPLEPPSGPMPSRIVETPSGPVRVPYDPAESPSDGYGPPSYDSAFDAMSSPSGAARTELLDAFPGAPGPMSPPQPVEEPPRPVSGPNRLGELPPGLRLSDPAPGAAPATGPFSLGGAATGPSPVGLGGATGPAGPGGPVDPGQGEPGGAPFGGGQGPSGAQQDPASPPPILPLTSDSRAARWPLASEDDLRNQSRDLSHEVTRGRVAALPPAGDRPFKGRRRPDETDNGWVEDGRPTPRLILAAVGAVGAVIAATIWFGSSLGGSPDETPPSAPAAASSRGQAGAPSSTARSQRAAAVPSGYKEHTSAGFTAAAPSGWKLSTSADSATLTGPKDSGVRVVVEQATPQADGGLAELARAEAEGGVDGYIQVQLQATQFRTWKAADWEYTYTRSNGVPMHTLTRYVTLDDDSAFKITFDMPELIWDDQAAARKVFLETFRKAA